MSFVTTYVTPILIGLLYALLNSLIREPHRRRFNAVMVGGAGAAYLSGGGLGGWEFAFTILVTYCAFRGLESWRFIGIAWLLHTLWDVVHHVNGHPIIPFADLSSLGCAICDPVIALWCLVGGPSLIDLARNRFSRRPARTSDVSAT
ncbi:hypothetical protein LX15_000019 [Streptoalloteichus tenebrarius]|uniref:Integral membrane protein n=1 Tax=Streptoalloteichus tenebrarius (strain ATCC 17920 / DSM 40477 / JCM 4838 / CBS 697.72 / NBRC 16177 / NCIMB 11028 / NRRL B-12390 / A12253. 1 / ISP 5477) TaxID=1933 RepID=A0ABT1HLF6_STRSD|nr:DUF6010 family protein [Streptoalloteichus tenebrarius]MCP2256336.1 hypothetical protein [Streptoalloteichus tenebrarius]BFF04675.1 DUF6010 family protein [Streptoalloteichus tenebrarius]